MSIPTWRVGFFAKKTRAKHVASRIHCAIGKAVRVLVQSPHAVKQHHAPPISLNRSDVALGFCAVRLESPGLDSPLPCNLLHNQF